jgi:hypothetical protein
MSPVSSGNAGGSRVLLRRLRDVMVQDTDTQNKFFVCKQKSQYLLLDSTFQQIGAAYSGMQKAEFGLVRQNVDYFIVQKNQKYGVMASTGKLVIPLGEDDQTMTLLIRENEKKFIKKEYGSFKFVPLLENKN